MGPSSAHHAVRAPVSERHVCCFVPCPFLVRRSVSRSCSHTPAGRCHLNFTFNSVSFFVRRSDFSFFNSIQVCFFNLFKLTDFCFATSAQCHWSYRLCRKRLDHLLSLPAENWTCFIEANPHVHCVHTIVHVQLDHCSVSSISNVRILFIQHHDGSSSDNFPL